MDISYQQMTDNSLQSQKHGMRIVFVSNNLFSINKMTIVALMNSLVRRCCDVFVITNSKNNYRDYRYDSRITRLPLDAPFKGCYTRIDVLKKYVSEMPPSIFLFTDNYNEKMLADLDTVKSCSSNAGERHRIILWESNLLIGCLRKGNLDLYDKLAARIRDFDAVVSNFKSHYILNKTVAPNSALYIPYLFPFNADEYAKASLKSNQILLFDSIELILYRDAILKQFADARLQNHSITLKIVSGSIKTLRKEILEGEYADIIQKYSLENDVCFEEDGQKISELLQKCAFALIPAPSGHINPISLQAYQHNVPNILLSFFDVPDSDNPFVFLNLNVENALLDRLCDFSIFDKRSDWSDKISHHLTDGVRNGIIDKWEDFFVKLYQDSDLTAIQEGFSSSYQTNENSIISFVDHQKKKILQSGSINVTSRDSKIKDITKKILISNSIFAKFIRAPRSFVNLTKYHILRLEKLRTSKYSYIQMSPEAIRKSQLLAMMMLRELERICKKHNLRYYIAAGSLLGTVRHKGPIPWDDDIDVTMPRNDYDRFIEIAQSELGEGFILPKCNYPYCFHRMQIVGTNIERTIQQRPPHGIFLDILPLDGAAPTEKKAKHQKVNERLIYLMFESARPLPIFNLSKKVLRAWFRRIILKYLFPKKLLMFLWKKNAAKYDTESSDEWICLPGIYGYEKECFPKAYWGEPCMVEFNGKLSPIMREWDKYLSLHYGNYMQTPSVLERRTHLLFDISFGKYETMSVEELENSLNNS